MQINTAPNGTRTLTFGGTTQTTQDLPQAGRPFEHYPGYHHGLRIPGASLPGPSNAGHVLWNQEGPRTLTGGEAHGDVGSTQDVLDFGLHMFQLLRETVWQRNPGLNGCTVKFN